MKKFSTLFILISISFFLQGCQKEPLMDDEQLKIPMGTTLSSEAVDSDLISKQKSCTTITVDAPPPPFGFMSPDKYLDEGLTIYANIDEEPHYMIRSGGCTGLEESIQALSVNTTASFLLNFSEPVESVSLIAHAPYANEMTLTAYTGLDGTGTTVDENNYNFTGERMESCDEYLITGTGINSVVISGQSEYYTQLLIYQVTYCESDSDGDGISNKRDNCPEIGNAEQEDYDKDGAGDACDSDLDGDGIENSVDPIPFSKIEATITLGECNSVQNQTTANGYTMGDELALVEAEVYKNEGQYKKAIAHLMESWIEQGLITAEEKDDLVACAN